MNYYLYFPLFLISLDEIQYISPPNSVQQLQVSWKLISQNQYFTEGCKWNFVHIVCISPSLHKVH